MKSPDACRTRPRPSDLADLLERIRAVEAGAEGWNGDGARPTAVVPTGWPEVDAALTAGGLRRGAVHDWIGLVEARPVELYRGAGRGRIGVERSAGGAEVETAPPARPACSHGRESADRDHRRRGGHRGGVRRGGGAPWSPPLCILSHLATQALAPAASSGGGDGGDTAPGHIVVWIGRRVHPYPRVLLRAARATRDGVHPSHRLLRCSLFVDPPDAASRLWAIDLALRSPAVAAVIADGSGLGMTETRRLQLAAETGAALGFGGSGAGGDAGRPVGGGGLALLARPPHELTVPSVAATRWRVGPAPSPSARPRWRLELLRAKDGILGASFGDAPVGRGHGRRTEAGTRDGTWILEWDHAQGAVPLSADVGHRPRAAPLEAARHARRGHGPSFAPARRTA